MEGRGEPAGAGADGIKFWTASPVSMSKVVLMPVDVAKHAIDVAHSLKKPVFAHPTHVQGAWLAAQTGIDVLAHPSTILFGTDVGYVTDYDPSLEYVLMARAGLSFQQILASLTTAPAAKFRVSASTGRIAAGMDADLVVLGADPATNVEAFTAVRYAYARGREVYAKN